MPCLLPHAQSLSEVSPTSLLDPIRPWPYPSPALQHPYKPVPSSPIFRASRLVVDTGLHALGWTRQEAVDYLINHTAMTTVKVENEVDRYITMPGQALAYKVGQLKLMDLRYKAASVLGDEFDIKKFHDVVLDSVGPLDLVEDEVNAWVNAGGKKLDVVRVIQCIKLWSC
ncbi:hypothetical protein Hamer_G030175 [Homarus americanus]|uniref:Uncharacterized protein n=1 Tax=Homarus americanus TaxID=6706 RepID=A0A8J5TLH8_HOMAM|nr:hypothetical protein Hamer_G030175 [Homarus americanus]